MSNRNRNRSRERPRDRDWSRRDRDDENSFAGRSAAPPATFQQQRQAPPMSEEWTCNKCSINNFNGRSSCFKCGFTRYDSEAQDAKGLSMVGVVPTDTLLIRELPSTATEESIRLALSRQSGGVPVKRVHIAPSRMFAFAQLGSPDEAQFMFRAFEKTVPYVDNCAVIVSHCKQSLNELLFSQSPHIGTAAMRMAQVHQQSPHQSPLVADRERNRIGAAPPPLQSSIGGSLTQTPFGQLQTYEPPDPKAFQYEDSSGYYYDAKTSFYYDPKSDYYYNSKTNQWMFWCTKFNTYINCEGGDIELKKQLQEEERAFQFRQKQMQERSAITASGGGNERIGGSERRDEAVAQRRTMDPREDERSSGAMMMSSSSNRKEQMATLVGSRTQREEITTTPLSSSGGSTAIAQAKLRECLLQNQETMASLREQLLLARDQHTIVAIQSQIDALYKQINALETSLHSLGSPAVAAASSLAAAPAGGVPQFKRHITKEMAMASSGSGPPRPPSVEELSSDDEEESWRRGRARQNKEKRKKQTAQRTPATAAESGTWTSSEHLHRRTAFDDHIEQAEVIRRQLMEREQQQKARMEASGSANNNNVLPAPPHPYAAFQHHPNPMLEQSPIRGSDMVNQRFQEDWRHQQQAQPHQQDFVGHMGHPADRGHPHGIVAGQHDHHGGIDMDIVAIGGGKRHHQSMERDGRGPNYRGAGRSRSPRSPQRKRGSRGQGSRSRQRGNRSRSRHDDRRHRSGGGSPNAAEPMVISPGLGQQQGWPGRGDPRGIGGGGRMDMVRDVGPGQVQRVGPPLLLPPQQMFAASSSAGGGQISRGAGGLILGPGQLSGISSSSMPSAIGGMNMRPNIPGMIMPPMMMMNASGLPTPPAAIFGSSGPPMNMLEPMPPKQFFPSNEDHWRIASSLQQQQRAPSQPFCSACGYAGHIDANCPMDPQNQVASRKKHELEKERDRLLELDICLNCGKHGHFQFGCRFPRISDEELQKRIRRAEEQKRRREQDKERLRQKAEKYPVRRKDPLIQRLRELAPHGKITKEMVRHICPRCAGLNCFEMCKKKEAPRTLFKAMCRELEEFTKVFFVHLNDDNLVDFSAKFEIFTVMDAIEKGGTIDPVGLQLQSLCRDGVVTQGALRQLCSKCANLGHKIQDCRERAVCTRQHYDKMMTLVKGYKELVKEGNGNFFLPKMNASPPPQSSSASSSKRDKPTKPAATASVDEIVLMDSDDEEKGKKKKGQKNGGSKGQKTAAAAHEESGDEVQFDWPPNKEGKTASTTAKAGGGNSTTNAQQKQNGAGPKTNADELEEEDEVTVL